LRNFPAKTLPDHTTIDRTGRLHAEFYHMPTTAPASAASANTTAVPNRRVLVIDDNADAADTLVAILSLLGHDAVAAHNGAEGLRAAEKQHPDVIFLDIGMPGMNGFEVAVAMRKISGLESVRIVALTAWRDEETRARAKAAGFDLHLTKPTSIEVIEEIIVEG
jgi:CheY-like chemotaxis protein